MSILRDAEQDDGLFGGDAADGKLEAVGQEGADPFADSDYCRPLGDVGIARIVGRGGMLHLSLDIEPLGSVPRRWALDWVAAQIG